VNSEDCPVIDRNGLIKNKKYPSQNNFLAKVKLDSYGTQVMFVNIFEPIAAQFRIESIYDSYDLLITQSVASPSLYLKCE
jgi:hypothetical protein